MTTKHTPGPWHLNHGFWVIDGRGELLVDVRGEHRPDAESLANAHLVAAAPDLLEVIETFIAARNSGVLGQLPGGFDEALTRVQAKARGGA